MVKQIELLIGSIVFRRLPNLYYCLYTNIIYLGYNSTYMEFDFQIPNVNKAKSTIIFEGLRPKYPERWLKALAELRERAGLNW